MVKIFSILTIVFVITINAQENFQKWLKEEQKKFKHVIQKEDSSFFNYLQQDWKEYKIFSSNKYENKPKPLVQPVFEKIEKNTRYSTVNEIDKLKKILLISNNIAEFKKGTVNFCDTEIEFIFPIRDTVDGSIKEVDKNYITNFLYKLTSNNHDVILGKLHDLRKMLLLNDWGYILLIDEIAKQIYPSSKDLRYLFIWYILTKDNFNVNICLVNKQVYLLIKTEEPIYNASYYLDNTDSKVYVIDIENINNTVDGNLLTYNDKNSTDLVKNIDLYINSEPLLGSSFIEKKFRFNYDDKEYEINAIINKGRIKFYENYPYTNLSVYFNSANKFNNSLLNSFVPILKDKNEVESVNLLLRFVQTAFDYKTDIEYFKKEKPMFPEEVFYYQYSDCEDRAVLFAYLVKNLIGLKVIGIDYPEHIAAAVAFNEKIEGKTINYKGVKYILCDPTYVGAPAGVCMPKYENSDYKIIEIN